ncbi:complex I NDUFA9 subunit family protein [Rhodospirillaceae bacterium SYSU D60014]|uniref:complex I NDUFA9 subunit family protein n=1 Tax=Virgifigura deserti TaxID=2268457 RepID=UPI000E66A348
MRILITGASGFIGRHLVAALSTAGHRIVCCVRDLERARRMFPAQMVVACDFTRAVDPELWLPRVRGVDAVINCAGILHARDAESIAAIHRAAPKALFTACLVAGVERVVQLSALGVGSGADSDYAHSKLAADDYLQSLGLDWTILRPSVVYTEAGPAGCASQFRTFATVPWFLPVVGTGEQTFQPIHMADLAEAVRRVVENGVGRRQVIDAVGQEPVSLAILLAEFRRRLGSPPARLVHLPLPLVRLIGRLGDRWGREPVTTAALTVMMRDNTADPQPFREVTGITSRRFADVFSDLSPVRGAPYDAGRQG